MPWQIRSIEGNLSHTPSCAIVKIRWYSAASNAEEWPSIPSPSNWTKSEDIWKKFRGLRNLLRTKIKQAKRTFYQKALSSKKPKELWQMIHRIINSSPKPISADPNELNVHLTNTTQRILGTNLSSPECLKNHITSLSNYGNDLFSLRPVSFKDVERQIKSIRTDCATGPDLI